MGKCESTEYRVYMEEVDRHGRIYQLEEATWQTSL